MIDIHCHILPGVDDGSRNWETTMEMCRIAYADGIRHIVATPHCSHRYAYNRSHHAELIQELRERVPEIEFTLGCDFNLSHENIGDAIAYPERYTIGSSPYLLVEFADFQTPHQMTESLFRLHSAGFLTIVTHPERNPIIDQYPDLPEKFAEMGSALQITSSALTGGWGRKAKNKCESFLKKDLVSFIATDAHDEVRRPPVLSVAREAARRIAGLVASQMLVQDNPRAVVSDEVLVEELSIG